MSIDYSKRQFLYRGMQLSAAAAAFAALPECIQTALALPANNATGTINDIQHIIILMQENRSFDHYFGTLPGVRGFGDRFTIPLPNNKTIWQQTYQPSDNQADNQNAEIIPPYYLNQTLGNAQRIGGTPHDWGDARDAWNKGRMSHWPTYKEPHSMAYYQQQELPFQFALANTFTLCDAYFCALHGGTNTNRLFLMTGTNGATTPEGKVVVTNTWDNLNTDTDLENTGFSWTTYPERLEKAGISWMVYQNMPHNYTDNPLFGFKQYRQANIDSGFPVYHNIENNPPYNPELNKIAPLYKGIANTLPDNGFLENFKRDILNNQLPQVSWIVAPAEYSEHTGPSSPVQGAWYTQQVIEALVSSPEVWSKTALIINFDENDGFFDHVPPPAAPSYNNENKLMGKTTLSPEQLSFEYYTHPKFHESNPQDNDCYGPGPRVPCYVISPWSRGGWVNSENFDHTSVLQLIEQRFGVKEDNISPYRRAVMGDLTSCFDFKNPNADIQFFQQLQGLNSKENADLLRNKQQDLGETWRNYSTLKSDLKGVQKRGIRSSRALPYRLSVQEKILSDSNKVQLFFSNTGEKAGVFHVYNHLELEAIPRRYMVETNNVLDDQWLADNTGNYHLSVFSSNGFYRELKGNIAEVQKNNAAFELVVQNKNNSLNFILKNNSAIEIPMELIAEEYFPQKNKIIQLKPQSEQTISWDLNTSQGWYDFSLISPILPSMQRRFAGRLENGVDSISDPVMGGI